MSIKNDNPDTKRPYQKPKLRTIELVADEVLAAGCKLKNMGLGTTPGTPCVAGIDWCWQEGS